MESVVHLAVGVYQVGIVSGQDVVHAEVDIDTCQWVLVL
jgi:hypothetical protein